MANTCAASRGTDHCVRIETSGNGNDCEDDLQNDDVGLARRGVRLTVGLGAMAVVVALAAPAPTRAGADAALLSSEAPLAGRFETGSPTAPEPATFVIEPRLASVWPAAAPSDTPAWGQPVESPHDADADVPEEDGAFASILGRCPNDEAPLRFRSEPPAAGTRAVTETIRRAADRTAVDPVYMIALADKESSLDPQARAKTSSAEGLYQFIDQTWLAAIRDFGPRHGLVAEAVTIDRDGGRFSIEDAEARERIMALRRDPYLAAVMAAELLKRDRDRLETELGREIAPNEFYLSHFLGQAGAKRLLALVAEKPSTAASARFPAAARANGAIFYERKGRRRRALSAAEVYGRLVAMMERRMDRYGDEGRRQQIAFNVRGR